MNYKEFLEYIYERHSGNVKLGLERMLSILAAMGEPNLHLPGIHVGGTNGKGSTCAMLETLCRAHGQKTGLNTSPHLVDYRERLRVNGVNIDTENLIRIYQKWESIFQKYEASFFEITTAMAFYYFLEQDVDTAIFEVGLGGRLDGTNPFAAEVAAITSISFDHLKSLGNTIKKIAWEKAGIIKTGQEVVLGELPEEAYDVIESVCQERSAIISRFGREFLVKNINLREDGTEFDYKDENVTWEKLFVNLIGEHQAHNAGVAIRTFRKMMQKRSKTVDEGQVRDALKNTLWLGRMQILQKEPLLLIDGAHNEEGISALVKNLQKIYTGRRIIFVLAILRDKNLEKMVNAVCTVADKLIISKNKSTRAAEIEEQVQYAEKYGADYETARDVVSGCRRAIALAGCNDVVIISGSLYTISEILAEPEFGENI
ncbi:MAG: bifunctional folylpolyglutamate synthase/dihydrofolate synthase [Candidatus Cloacimonetes bacterium]|nr:bifunctional folylpolyglutamate synthase/dihydrofolate synthase [Candidatus Cloacimonadota bacterium]